MDAVEFLKAHNRMCKSNVCSECEAYDCCYDTFKFKELVAFVEKWAAAHPCKTRQKEFLKQWPNVYMVDGVIHIYPCNIDTKFTKLKDCDGNCESCRREFWMKEVE